MSDFFVKVQASINGLHEGVTHSVLWTILFLCFGATLAGGFAWTQFRGLHDAEAMEYAQLGRNIADGNGFVTKCIRPVDFRTLDINTESEGKISYLPELRKGPIYPLLLSLGFKISKTSFSIPDAGKLFKPEAMVVVPLGIIFFLLTAILVFFIGLKLFNQQVALLSMVLTLVNGSLLSFSIAGNPMPIVLFFTSAIILLVLHASSLMNTNKSWMLWGALLLVAGILCGMAFLTLYAMIALLPMVLIWLWVVFDQKRLLAVGVLVVFFVLCITPWILHNQAVSGSLFGLAPSTVIHDTFMYNGDAYDRELAPELSNSITSLAIKNKFKATLSQVFSKNMGLGGLGIIGAFFLVSLLSKSEQQENNLLKWIILTGVFSMVIIIGLCGIESLRMMTIFFPIMIVFGVAFFCELVARLTNYVEDYDLLPAVILVVIVSLPVVLTVFSIRGSVPYPPYYPPLVSYVTNMLDDNEMLCTDIPWATAWYGNQPSVLLPAKVGDLDRMGNFGWKCSGIYLAEKITPKNSSEDSSWQTLRRKEVPKNFALIHGINLPPGRMDQFFLTDRIRW